jgi:fucose permease
LDLGGDWRSVYFGVVGLEALILVALSRHIEAYDVDPQTELTSYGKPTGGAGADTGAALVAAPMPVASLLGMLGVFFFYVAPEAGYGHWTYSVLTEERGVSDGLAGAAVAGYWGGLTAGRMLLGMLGDRVRPTQLVRWSLVSVVAGAAVFWLDPLPGLDLVSLLWLGMSMAGVFPAMVLLTPSWVGSANTSRAVGYQLGAASVGVILSSQAIGALVRAYGLDAVPPTLAAITCATLLMFLLAERLRVYAEASVALEGSLDEPYSRRGDL